MTQKQTMSEGKPDTTRCPNCGRPLDFSFTYGELGTRCWNCKYLSTVEERREAWATKFCHRCHWLLTECTCDKDWEAWAKQAQAEWEAAYERVYGKKPPQQQTEVAEPKAGVSEQNREAHWDRLEAEYDQYQAEQQEALTEQLDAEEEGRNQAETLGARGGPDYLTILQRMQPDEVSGPADWDEAMQSYLHPSGEF